LGLIHPEHDLIHYPEYPDPTWRSFGRMLGHECHKFVSSDTSGAIDVRGLWLKECSSDWVKEHNSSEGENSED
jgi:hypothetical protein